MLHPWITKTEGKKVTIKSRLIWMSLSGLESIDSKMEDMITTLICIASCIAICIPSSAPATGTLRHWPADHLSTNRRPTACRYHHQQQLLVGKWIYPPPHSPKTDSEIRPPSTPPFLKHVTSQLAYLQLTVRYYRSDYYIQRRRLLHPAQPIIWIQAIWLIFDSKCCRRKDRTKLQQGEK